MYWVKYQRINYRPNKGNLKDKPTHDTEMKLYIKWLIIHIQEYETSLDVRPNLEIASDHTPIIATISTYLKTHQKPPKLHNSQTNWEAFRTQIEETLRLNIPLETVKHFEEVIDETAFTRSAAEGNLLCQKTIEHIEEKV
jgi:hypothetical protein